MTYGSDIDTSPLDEEPYEYCLLQDEMEALMTAVESIQGVVGARGLTGLIDQPPFMNGALGAVSFEVKSGAPMLTVFAAFADLLVSWGARSRNSTGRSPWEFELRCRPHSGQGAQCKVEVSGASLAIVGEVLEDVARTIRSTAEGVTDPSVS